MCLLACDACLRSSLLPTMPCSVRLWDSIKITVGYSPSFSQLHAFKVKSTFGGRLSPINCKSQPHCANSTAAADASQLMRFSCSAWRSADTLSDDWRRALEGRRTAGLTFSASGDRPSSASSSSSSLS